MSRWYIPPFKGKSKKNSEKSEKKLGQEKEIKEIEIEDMKARIKQLQNILNEHEEEHKCGMDVMIREYENLSKEVNEIKMKMALKKGYSAIFEKIETQKLEAQEIKTDINKIKVEIENLTQCEENLYFDLQEKKMKIKEMNEEIQKSYKEIQLNSSHYKLLYKDLQEKNENLQILNRSETRKNELLKNFINKVNKKQEKEAEVKIPALHSEYRVLKMQLQAIEAEIADIRVSLINHSNSIISQTYDYTETSY